MSNKILQKGPGHITFYVKVCVFKAPTHIVLYVMEGLSAKRFITLRRAPPPFAL